MENIIQEPIARYLAAKQMKFAGNELASKFRKDFPGEIQHLIADKNRYKVIGSTGKGNWSECPWIAILDILVTNTPQSGYYPVFIFKADMSGVYLSLNQGVTEVKEYYRKETKKVLKLRAEDFRAKLDSSTIGLYEIDLCSNADNAKLYEAGNIIAKYYSSDNIPDSQTLKEDIFYFLKVYEELAFNDTQIEVNNGLTAIERKKYRLHFRIERNSSIAKRVKAVKGYVCEVCGFDFKSKYGLLGANFIEAHHLTPIASLDIGEFKIDVQKDFAVLCSNCHRMVHRLDDPSDINKLREIIVSNS